MAGAQTSARQQFTEAWDGTALWFQQHYAEILIGIAAGTIIVLALFALRGLGRRLCRHDRQGTGWTTILGRAIDKTGTIFIVVTAAKLVEGYARPPELIEQTIDFVFTIVSVIQVAVWAREIVLGFVERRTASGDQDALGSAVHVIRILVSVVLFILAGVVILDNLGVNVTGLVAGLGIGGIAIGLAAQGIFADLFAALSILFDRPFRRGDSIAYDQTNATVEAIGLKSTRLRSVTGEQRVISNKNLLDKEIRNNTRLEHRRGRFALSVVYQLDRAKAERLPDLLKALVEAEGLEFVRGGLVGFGPSSLHFEVDFDVLSDDYEAFYQARHRLGLAVLARLAAEGIELAYPSQTTFTAAPDGRLVMPYAEGQDSPAPPRT